jgi:undecaprenyl-diphosphatase
VNSFDASILHFVNAFAGRWPRFDQVVVMISWLHLVKGGVLMVLLWWAWFSGKPAARETVSTTLLGSFLALGAARGLSNLLPFRTRPILDPSLHFVAPVSMNGQGLMKWSSFPSDHAALFIGISTGLWLVSRKAGLFAFGYTILFILLPRLYIGAHFPTDLIAGGLIGWLLVAVISSSRIRDRIGPAVLGQVERRTAVVYPLLFLVTFETAELFDSVRLAVHLLRRIFLRGA